MFPHYVKLTNIWRKNLTETGVFIISWTGSTDESKEKADQEPNTKDEQDNETFNNAQDEGNMSDEAERDGEGKGQQEQQAMQDMEEESANLDLPDDLQLDEEGNERSDGE